MKMQPGATPPSRGSPPQATGPLPPTFMYCTAEDGAVLGMMTMYTSLRRKGVPAEIHFFEKGPHDTAFALGDPVLGEWPNLLFNWLRQRGYLTGAKRMALEGIVKLDGEPLPRGTIIFQPIDQVGAPTVIGYFSTQQRVGRAANFAWQPPRGQCPASIVWKSCRTRSGG